MGRPLLPDGLLPPLPTMSAKEAKKAKAREAACEQRTKKKSEARGGACRRSKPRRCATAERVPFFLAFTSNNDEAGESNRGGHETKRGSERFIPALRSRGKNEEPSDKTLHRRGSTSSRYRSGPRAVASRLPATSGNGGGEEHDDIGDDESMFDMMEPGSSTGGLRQLTTNLPPAKRKPPQARRDSGRSSGGGNGSGKRRGSAKSVEEKSSPGEDGDGQAVAVTT